MPGHRHAGARRGGVVGRAADIPPKEPVLPAEPRIFICYRREDSSDSAHRLYDSLSWAFGDDGEVFIDLNVPRGAGVRRYITDKLRSCEVLLVVIGPQWLSAVDEHGARRLDNELDYVRLEISVALTNRIPVMPLLVKGAGMPLARDLPRASQRSRT